MYNEIQYTHSVDKSMMPRFMPIRPPNPEQSLRADVQESPAIIQLSQPILTDIPQEEFAVPPDIGGDLTTLTKNISELGPEETVQSSPPDNMVSSVDTSQHITDTPDSGALTDPPGDATLPLPPPLANTLNTDITEEESRERVSRAKIIDYFRSGQGTLKKPLEQGATFVTCNTPLVTRVSHAPSRSSPH